MSAGRLGFLRKADSQIPHKCYPEQIGAIRNGEIPGGIRNPSLNMKLNPKQLEAVTEYVKKWKRPECVLCGHDEWSVSAIVFELPQYGLPPPPFDYYMIPQVFPVVPLTCTTCGNVLFLSAILAGVLPKPGGAT